jgi:hypothetical protein
MTMYHEAMLQLAQNLTAVEIWLDKAEAFAAANHLAPSAILNERLAPDMQGFIYQIQSASDYIKGGAAWLSGQTPPRYEDSERTFDEVRERICKTVKFVESLEKTQFAHADQQKVSISWAPAGKILGGEDYLLQVVIPNAYFHIAMAYGILRHHGVDIGKMDFLGSIKWVDA